MTFRITLFAFPVPSIVRFPGTQPDLLPTATWAWTMLSNLRSKTRPFNYSPNIDVKQGFDLKYHWVKMSLVLGFLDVHAHPSDIVFIRHAAVSFTIQIIFGYRRSTEKWFKNSHPWHDRITDHKVIAQFLTSQTTDQRSLTHGFIDTST